MKTKSVYFENGRLLWDKKSEAGRFVKQKCKPLKCHKISDEEDEGLLFDIIEKMLNFDPHKRISLADALDHSFFAKISDRQRLDAVVPLNDN
jgi:CDC-like kinase